MPRIFQPLDAYLQIAFKERCRPSGHHFIVKPYPRSREQTEPPRRLRQRSVCTPYGSSDPLPPKKLMPVPMLIISPFFKKYKRFFSATLAELIP